MGRRPNASRHIDPVDRAILNLVQRDAKLPQADIARAVGLSAPSVNQRLRKLERWGVIRRYGAVVDPAALGATLTAFVEVFIEHRQHEPAFITRVLALDEVLECHHVTGESSLLLKVRVRDMDALRDLLLTDINAQEGVRQTRTAMVLDTLKEESAVVLAERGVSR